NVYITGYHGAGDEEKSGTHETPREGSEGYEVTIYYKHGFNTPYIHYRPEGGQWTDVPGVTMEQSEYAGYSKITIDIGASTQLEADLKSVLCVTSINNGDNNIIEMGNNVYILGNNGEA